MDSEDMNFVKSDPALSKLKNSDILKDLTRNCLILVQTRDLNWNSWFSNMNTYFRIINLKLTKFIMTLNLLMVQNLWNNIHTELTL